MSPLPGEIENAKALVSTSNLEGQARVLRALVSVLLDEVNTLRTLHGLPQRTLAQAKTAILNRLDDSAVD